VELGLVLAQTSLTDSLKATISDIIAALPGVIAAIIIVILGYIIGGILGKATNRIVQKLVEEPLSKTEIGKKYKEYGIDLSDFTGGAVKAFVIAVSLIIALQYLNIGGAAFEVLASIVYYLPRLIGGIVVLVYGVILAGVLADFISMGFEKGLEDDRIGKMIKSAVFIGLLAIVITIALNLLGLAGTMVYTLILGIIVIGLGIMITDTLIDSLGKHEDFKPYVGYAKFIFYTVFLITGLAGIFALYPGTTTVLARLAWGIAIAFALILLPLIYGLAKKLAREA